MASKKDPTGTAPPRPSPPPPKPAEERPVRTQMVGEHGDEDIGYDPGKIPVEDIPDDDGD